MTLYPVNDRILVEPVEAPEMTPGGIIIADTAKETPTEGVIVAVGPGRVVDNGEPVKVRFRKGQRIYHHQYAGVPLEHEGKTYRVMGPEDILCIIAEDPVTQEEGDSR